MKEIAIEAQNLTVAFNSYRALQKINLQIPLNAFVAIVGPNGAGKSTFLKTLLGLIQPSEGHIFLFGKKPGKIPSDWIGYVPQFKTMNRSFPALSIELVLTGISHCWPARIDKADRQKALNALELVGAGPLAQQSIRKLSGGELQRVYLARAFVRQPKLIMLDEPATGIDVAGQADLFRLLENYQKNSGATILMITHDWHTSLHHANLVLLINRSQISFGAPKETLSETNLRLAFGHIGHTHTMQLGEKQNG